MTESDDYWTEIDGGSEFHSRQTVVATNEAGLVPETMPGANALARLTAILFSDPTWQTYALIDPSLVFGLSVELGKSDEFHRCLHRNPDHGNAGEAYPWLVRLQPKSPVFHKLCTSGQPRGWWEDEVGIFIRTTLPPGSTLVAFAQIPSRPRRERRLVSIALLGPRTPAWLDPD